MTKLQRKRARARLRRQNRHDYRELQGRVGVGEWLRDALASPYWTSRPRYSERISDACFVVRDEWPRGRGPHSFALYRLVRWWGDRIEMIPSRIEWEQATGRKGERA